ncbi:STAS domain-containing protein [Flavivirga eckloniae]|uniref:STAS domain-containing protein n=1 Tax=Flavivirga eckloniae TaxID=1803846 RepID=A0A2K9PKS8_9FLAO|nr:STAS domain-containing protein [Flavivirga eckloniae]AUP77642.1 hypothetical protein C1H87_02490 [Flavivirga eckloniae]
MNLKTKIMALRITEQNGIFFLEGAINVSTTLNFQNHLESILNQKKGLTIDVENVTEIDPSGMQVLRELYSKAQSKKRPFFVVGTGCKEIYDDFLHTCAA